MTPEETRKLLGGYATDALSAHERRILFEAALEDQELFNALNDEDALRELLADPVSREQVRGALAGLTASKRRPSFWSRRWVFGVAIPAVAAVILIAVMNHANAPRLIAPAPATVPAPRMQASNIAPAAAPALPEAKKQSAPRRVSAPKAVPALAPRFLAAPAPPMPDAVRQQFAAGFTASAPIYQGPMVRYSIVRSDDRVRVEVSSGIMGYLALYQVDSAGNSKRVYPASEMATRVLPNIAIQIPSDPLKVNVGESLRLVVIPAASSAAVGSLGGALSGTALGTGARPIQPPPTPLVIDIPLGPN